MDPEPPGVANRISPAISLPRSVNASGSRRSPASHHAKASISPATAVAATRVVSGCTSTNRRFSERSRWGAAGTGLPVAQ